MKTVPIVLHVLEDDNFDGLFVEIQTLLARHYGFATLGATRGTGSSARRLDAGDVVAMHRAPRWPRVASKAAV